MLRVDRLNVAIQGSHILHDVSLQVAENELVCLVGRNGAGKTTIFRTIMGYLRPMSGTISFAGNSIVGLPTHEIAAKGIGFAPEEGEIFGDLTVAENIELPTWTRQTARPPRERIELAYAMFPKLREYGLRGGNNLSGGERKMLSIARALVLDAPLLILDEPFEGLSPAIIPTITESIVEIARLGRSILLAESNIHHAPELANRLYVVERGEIIFDGHPRTAFRDAQVMQVIEGSVQ